VTTTITCPHCKRELVDSPNQRHELRCVYRPGVRDLLRKLLQSDDPTRAVPRHVYAERVAAYNAALRKSDLRAPTVRALDQLGGWGDACAWAGLERSRRVGGESNGNDFAVIAEAVQVEMETARAALRDAERGLPVCRVVELPDGRVRCMLR